MLGSQRRMAGLAAALAVFPAIGQAPRPSPSRAQELTLDRFTWSKEVDGETPIRAVEVRNDYGDVRARFAGDRRLEAHAVIQRLGAPPGVGVTVERRGEVMALTVAYPPGRIQDADPDPPKDSYDRLDLVVFVPAGVAFSGHTLRGMVEVRGLQSDVRAATRQGPIEVRTTGAIEARTQDGAISAAFGEARDGRFNLLESGTGSVAVTLPPGDHRDLRVETSGAVVSDVRLQREQNGGRTVATGRLGRGGPLLFVFSRSGPVELRRGPS